MTSSLLWGVTTALQIGAVASNAPILLVIWSRGLLTSPNTRLVFSLCLSHLLLCLFLLISSWLPVPFFLDSVHHLIPTLAGLIVQLASLSLLTGISLDRYVSIARPMECTRILTPQRALLAISLSWSLALILVLPPGILLSTSSSLLFWWNIYFGLLLFLATLVAIVLMTLAYSHIFKIARQKCHKVRLGEFRRAPGSISSEWGTSVGCGAGVGRNLPQKAPPPLNRALSQSLLQKLLQQRTSSSSSTTSSSISSPSSTCPSSRSGSGSSGTSSQSRSNTSSKDKDPLQEEDAVAGMARAKRRWRAYLRHNYNSPKKTVCTILTLIGSVVVCSLPPALALLFLPSLFPTLQALLLPLSSNLHPLLYGLLNRAIRHHLVHGKRAALLPKSLRLKRGQRRKVSTLGELRSIFIPNSVSRNNNQRRRRKKGNKDKNNSRNNSAPSSATPSRRGSTTSGTEDERADFLMKIALSQPRPRLDTGQLPGSSRRWTQRSNPIVLLVEDDPEQEQLQEQVQEEDQEIVEVDEEMPQLAEIHVRRKSSQDSGADMNFSETEDEEVGVVNEVGGCLHHNIHNNLRNPFLVLTTSQSESNLSCGYSSNNHKTHHLLYPTDKLSPLKLSPLSLSADAHLHILNREG